MRSNNTYLNILSSFAYLYNNKELSNEVFSSHNEGLTNVMIDSEAFTLFNANQKREWLTVDNYCNFLEKHSNSCEKYVMLDKVGDDVQSKKNYELMVDRGFKPMYVLTMFDKDWDYFRSSLNVNPHCCIAGGVTTKSDWMTKRFQDAYKNSNKKARMHGLGYVTFPKSLQLSLESVDSSSWIMQPQAYGIISYFDRGIKGSLVQDILAKKKRIPEKLREIMDRIEVTSSMFANKENHKGSSSIATLCSMIAYIEYQKYCYRRGLRLFLALGNAKQLRRLIYISKNLNTVTYEKFLQIK